MGCILQLLRSIIPDGHIYLRTYGGNNNRHIRVVPNINVVAKVLDEPWPTTYVGHTTEIDRKSRFLILGSIPKATTILVGRS